MNRFELQFFERLLKALYAHSVQFAATYEKHGEGMALIELDNFGKDYELERVMKEYYSTVGLYFLLKIDSDFEKKGLGFGINNFWVKKILDFFDTYLLEKVIIPIAENTRKQIIALLARKQTEGWGIERTVSEIKDIEIPKWRARMILRTEGVRAMSVGHKIGVEESPFEHTKKWISATDHRTRHGHLIMNGQMIDETDKFSVPIYDSQGIQTSVELMTGPGDVNASAANVINCRCTLALRLKKGADGRFVRKKQLVIN